MIDFTKPVFTKSGLKFTLLTDSLKSFQPVVGIVRLDDGTEEVEKWNLDGSYYLNGSESTMDLTNEPPKTLVG